MVKIIADNMETVLVDPAIVLEGKNGKDGERGEQGAPGIDGLPGRDGKDGKDGRDGLDGRDGKDGFSFWIEYDKKTNTLVFKNNGGKKNPDPIKLPAEAKGWGFGAGRGGGVTAQADWNQKDKHAVDYIKNKPVIHNVSWKIVDTLPAVGNSWTIYLVPTGEELGSNKYTEWIFVEDEQTQTLYWEELGEELDLSGYELINKPLNTLATSGTISPATNTHNYVAPTGAITLSLPASPDTTIVNEIELQVNQTSAVGFDFGTVLWGDEGTPDMSVGIWDFIFTYIGGNWCASYKKWETS